jgi:hypothetical protein
MEAADWSDRDAEEPVRRGDLDGSGSADRRASTRRDLSPSDGGAIADDATSRGPTRTVVAPPVVADLSRPRQDGRMRDAASDDAPREAAHQLSARLGTSIALSQPAAEAAPSAHANQKAAESLTSAAESVATDWSPARRPIARRGKGRPSAPPAQPALQPARVPRATSPISSPASTPMPMATPAPHRGNVPERTEREPADDRIAIRLEAMGMTPGLPDRRPPSVSTPMLPMAPAAPAPRPVVQIDRLAVTLQAPAVISSPSPATPLPSSPSRAPSAQGRAFRNPWASYYLRRD